MYVTYLHKFAVFRKMLKALTQELLLASARVEPKKLLATGYQFRQPTLEESLRHVLGRKLKNDE